MQCNDCILIKKKHVPWWNKASDKAVRDRNRAYRALRKRLTEERAIECKRFRAKARRVIKSAKKKKSAGEDIVENQV